jgi:hypothetical protein
MTLERPLLCDVRHTVGEILLFVTNETSGNKRARLNSTHYLLILLDDCDSIVKAWMHLM